MSQGPGRTQRQITRVLERGQQMTATDLARALQVERGVDAEPSLSLVQSVHRALRVMMQRGEVQRLPVEDTLSQWAFTLAPASSEHAGFVTGTQAARFTSSVRRSADRLAEHDYVAVCCALLDRLPADEAQRLVDILARRVASR